MERLNYDASFIFDPIPSYDGDWQFTLNNLLKNAKKENGQNLFQKYWEETYAKPLTEIFQTRHILDFKVGMMCSPKPTKKGRFLHYSYVDLIGNMLSFLNKAIDNYGTNKEEHDKYLQSILDKLGTSEEDFHIAISEALKAKAQRLKDVMDNEINSEYFEATMQDYAPYKNQMNFLNYVKLTYEVTTKFESGILKLGSFYRKELDYQKLASCFDPDEFYLLFAKIIYEYNLIREKESGYLDNSYSFLATYRDILNEIIATNKRYNPQILYTLPSGKKIRYNRWDFQKEYAELIGRHPEAKRFKLPILEEGDERYKDIELMAKLSQIYTDDVFVNWEFLPKGTVIKKTSSDSRVVSKESIDKDALRAEVNKRITFLENSGIIGTPIKGKNTFNGYYAFVYSNGKVILEKFWENEETMNPATKAATYVMTIENFVEMSKLPKPNLIEFMQTLPNIDMKRIFHTSYAFWERCLCNEIALETKYHLEDAIEFINSLKNGELKNEQQ